MRCLPTTGRPIGPSESADQRKKIRIVEGKDSEIMNSNEYMICDQLILVVVDERTKQENTHIHILQY